MIRIKKIIRQSFKKIGFKIEKIQNSNVLYPVLKKFDVGEKNNLLFCAKEHVIKLDDKFDDLSISNHKAGVLVGFLDLKIYVESIEEFFILKEVFIDEEYKFLSNKSSIVIDIGANVGISSLYLSRLKHVEAIYGFEPVLQTFEQAKYNFKLNNKISKVISIKNVGLGSSNRNEIFLYNKHIKGNTGIRGELSPMYANSKNTESVEVKINKASDEIKGILTQVKDKNIIIKMDCEGAEYEILEDLKNTGILIKIDCIILEWHDKGSAIIEEILLSSGFTVFSRSLGPISGMICAHKTS